MTENAPAARGTLRLSNSAWESLLRAQMVMMRDFAAEDIWEGASVKEYDVLYTLTKAGEGLRLAELNDSVLLSQPALSRMVDRMGARGLLARRADPADRRGIIISLTEAGQQAQRRIGRRHAASVHRAMSAVLTADEMRTLELLCRRLAAPEKGESTE